MWILFTILTTLSWGFAELFYKKGAIENERYAHLKICVYVGIAMGLHALFTLLTGDFSYDIRNLIQYLPVSLCYIISMACSFFGMRFIEESISDPLENTSGALCTLLCVIFLKAELAPLSFVAILIILCGILGISFLEHKGETNRAKKLGKRLAVIAFLMPFLYAFLDAFGSFLDVYYLEMETSPLIGITEENIETIANTSYELTFAFVALVLFIFLKVKRVKLVATGARDKALAAVFETAGQLTYVYAMSGNGAVAAPIISSVCVVSLIFSRIFLKEKLTKKQYFYIALVIIGILMLAILEGD